MTALTYQYFLNQFAQNPQSTLFDYSQFMEENNLKNKNLVNSYCRLTSSSIFLLDYSSLQYPYMDPSAKMVLGHSNQAFHEGGIEFSLHHCHGQDKQLYNKKIFPDRLALIQSKSYTNPVSFRFSHTFRLRRPNGIYDHFLQQCTFIHTPAIVGPIAVFGVVTNITSQGKAGTVANLIERLGPNGNWIQELSKNYISGIEDEDLLTKREIEILKWAQEGHQSQLIAQKLNISIHTVNTHRKNMLQKTNSKNIMELIHFANTHGFI
jgi:DNA-binding CsgD family transcriptional regulator